MPYLDPSVRRAYLRVVRARYRGAGGCYECGVPSGRFARCLRHRVIAAAARRAGRRVQRLERAA